jgi:dolichol kinase
MRKHGKKTRHGDMKKEAHVTRKIIHLFSILTVPADILAHDLTLLTIFSIFTFYLIIAYLRARQKHVPVATNIINWLSREDEKGGILGPPTYLFISIIFLLTFAPPFAAYVGIISAAVGDTFASLAGSIISGKKLVNEKTFAGALGFFIPTFTIFYFLLGLDHALVIAASGSLAELLSHKYDNLTVPIITASVTMLIF